MLSTFALPPSLVTLHLRETSTRIYLTHISHDARFDIPGPPTTFSTLYFHHTLAFFLIRELTHSTYSDTNRTRFNCLGKILCKFCIFVTMATSAGVNNRNGTHRTSLKVDSHRPLSVNSNPKPHVKSKSLPPTGQRRNSTGSLGNSTAASKDDAGGQFVHSSFCLLKHILCLCSMVLDLPFLLYSSHFLLNNDCKLCFTLNIIIDILREQM